MPFGVSELIIAIVVMGFLVVVGWIIARAPRPQE